MEAITNQDTTTTTINGSQRLDGVHDGIEFFHGTDGRRIEFGVVHGVKSNGRMQIRRFFVESTRLLKPTWSQHLME